MKERTKTRLVKRFEELKELVDKAEVEASTAYDSLTSKEEELQQLKDRLSLLEDLLEDLDDSPVIQELVEIGLI